MRDWASIEDHEVGVDNGMRHVLGDDGPEAHLATEGHLIPTDSEGIVEAEGVHHRSQKHVLSEE